MVKRLDEFSKGSREENRSAHKVFTLFHSVEKKSYFYKSCKTDKKYSQLESELEVIFSRLAAAYIKKNDQSSLIPEEDLMVEGSEDSTMKICGVVIEDVKHILPDNVLFIGSG